MKACDHKFSENGIKQLRSYRDRQKDAGLKQRFLVLLAVALHPEGIAAGIGYASDVFGKCIATIGNRLNKYLTGGADVLNSFNCKPKKSYPNRYEINQVIIHVTFDNPDSVKEVKDYTEQKFGISCCADAVRKLLIKNGLEVMRPNLIPGNPPSPEVRKQYIGKYHQKRQKPDPIFLFCDVMHLIHQNFPGLCRGKSCISADLGNGFRSQTSEYYGCI